MYQVVIDRKNKEKFVRWFMRQPRPTRNYFVVSFSDFLTERSFHFDISMFADRFGRFLYREFAAYFFDELGWWSVSSLFFLPESMEVCYNFHPFVHWQKGKKSTFLERERIQNSFINPSF